MSEIFDLFQSELDSRASEEYTLQEWLDGCRDNRGFYANAAERMLTAIGKPTLVNTSEDTRLSRIFQNRVIKHYATFDSFYGIEETIEKIVDFLTHAADGLEERKQILYLLGPVGTAKSSLAERLKQLIESQPIYVLKMGEEVSPIYESPLGLFDKDKHGKFLEDKYGIPSRYLGYILSPWAVKRLREAGGRIDRFKVVKMYPSRLYQIAVAKTEPGDENNQDISSLVGKVDIRKLREHKQNDADAYSFSGGLCLANQGLLEFVEMFKAPIKMLHPLLTATQEGNYNGIEGAPIPFNGVILAHSNESEWQAFKSNKNNEAFLDRVSIIKVPYCLRVNEEIKIYEKMIDSSALDKKKVAPGTLDFLAKWSILTRLKEPENSTMTSKLKVYNGENLKDVDPKAKSVQEYKQNAGVDEGMTGMSTRFAYKILSQVFDKDPEERAANPVHLMTVLQDQIEQEQLGQKLETEYKQFIKTLRDEFGKFIEKEIKTACLEQYSEFGQNIFDNYLTWATAWIKENDYRDETGQTLNREALDNELSKVEKPAGIANPKEFRQEVVMFCLEAKGKLGGKNPAWTSYEKMKEVIEARIFQTSEELLPIITFNAKASKEDQEKHRGFLDRMAQKGYTHRQTRLLADWWRRWKRNT